MCIRDRSGPVGAATLLLDYDASVGVNATAGSVSSWEDQVGGAGVRDATPVGGTVAPVLEANVFAGGQPGIKFDGGDSVLAFSDAGLPIDGNSYTLVAAWKAETFGQSGGGFSRPTLAGYGPGGVNHQDGAHLAIRPDANTAPDNAVAIHRTNGGDQNFGGVPPSETGTFPVVSGTPYVQIVSKISDSELTGTLITADGTLTGTDTGLNPSDSQVRLGSGYMGNMLAPGPGDFNESRFTGWIGRLQIYEGALDAGELSAVVAQMSSYAVPEPTGIILLLFGLFGLTLRRRWA